MAQLESLKLQLISQLEIAKKNNLSELQNKYLKYLLQNYSIFETIEQCMINGTPIHFQTFYNLIILLWKTQCIQNSEANSLIKTIHREIPNKTFFESLTQFIIPTIKPKGTNYNLETLGQLPFFNNLPFKWLQKLYDHSSLIETEPQNLLIRQGSQSRDLFLLLEGSVAVYKRSEKSSTQFITQIKAPAIYGEGGFFFNHPRSADIISVSHCKIIRFVFQSDYEKIFKIQDEKNLTERFWLLHALNKSELFHDVPTETINHVLTIGYTRKISKNQILFDQGDFGDTFYILIQGELDVEQNGRIINTLRQGKCFGELALLASQGQRTATIRASADSLLFEISKQDFYPFLAKNIYLAKELERVAEIRLQRDKKRKAA